MVRQRRRSFTTFIDLKIPLRLTVFHGFVDVIRLDLRADTSRAERDSCAVTFCAHAPTEITEMNIDRTLLVKCEVQ